MADEQKPEGPVPSAPEGQGAPPLPPKPAPAAAPLNRRPKWPLHRGKAICPTDSRALVNRSARVPLLRQNFVVVAGCPIPLIEFLKLEADTETYLVDVTAVDYPKRAERFELFYILYSFARNERLRVKAMIADGAKPATAVGVHPGANWLEREVFDMFGIQFEGHPDMRRILMPEEWEGFPLRKDYGILKQDDRWVRENLGIESGQ